RDCADHGHLCCVRCADERLVAGLWRPAQRPHLPLHRTPGPQQAPACSHGRVRRPHRVRLRPARAPADPRSRAPHHRQRGPGPPVLCREPAAQAPQHVPDLAVADKV
ncbi:hypothetical protein IWQ56_004135, partial [Coemansia nantahalensis]